MSTKKQVFGLTVATLDQELPRIRANIQQLFRAMYAASKRGEGIEVVSPEGDETSGSVATPLGLVQLELGYIRPDNHVVGVLRLSRRVQGIHGEERRPIGAFQIHPYQESIDAAGKEFVTDAEGEFNTSSGRQALSSLIDAQMRAHIKDSTEYLDA